MKLVFISPRIAFCFSISRDIYCETVMLLHIWYNFLLKWQRKLFEDKLIVN